MNLSRWWRRVPFSLAVARCRPTRYIFPATPGRMHRACSWQLWLPARSGICWARRALGQPLSRRWVLSSTRATWHSATMSMAIRPHQTGPISSNSLIRSSRSVERDSMLCTEPRPSRFSKTWDYVPQALTCLDCFFSKLPQNRHPEAERLRDLSRDTALDGAESKDPEDAYLANAVRSFLNHRSRH